MNQEMNRHQIQHIIKRHSRNLKKHFKNVNQDFAEEEIHQLRVEYKKLRAFLRLLCWQANRREKEFLPRRLKRCYAIAGAIRDLQLQQKRLPLLNGTSNNQPGSYMHQVKEQINILKPTLNKLLRKKTINKIEKKIGAIIPEDIGSKKLMYYFEDILQSITSLVKQDTMSDQDVHKVRKLLKDFFYNRKAIAKSGELVFDSKEFIYGDLDQLLEEIGRYIDKCRSIDLLKPPFTGELNSENKQVLSRVRAQLLQEKSNLKNTLEQKLIHQLHQPQL